VGPYQSAQRCRQHSCHDPGGGIAGSSRSYLQCGRLQVGWGVYRVTITGWVPLETCQDPAQWGTAIGKFLSNLEPEDQMEDSDKFMAILIPDQIEKELDRSALIDEKNRSYDQTVVAGKVAKQISLNTRTKPQSEPRPINPQRALTCGLLLRMGSSSGERTFRFRLRKQSTSPNALRIRSSSRNPNSAPKSRRQSPKNVHSEPVLVKLEYFAKRELFSKADIESFLAICDACRADEGYVIEPLALTESRLGRSCIPLVRDHLAVILQ
jgi:hypothetical protein